MAPYFPYTKYLDLPLGAPITFLIDTSSQRYDVHSFLLADNSPAFIHINGEHRIPKKPIELPNIFKDDFVNLAIWLYERKPPAYTHPRELRDICQLWIAAGELGLYKQQNTLMRLGMALMQPRHFECDVDVVRYVYENTPGKSKLRGFIVAIFCQRSEVKRRFFNSSYERLGILGDAAAFLKKLEMVRMRNPKPIDWDKVEYPLPDYLVWSERGEDVPDCFFVTIKEAVEAAREIVEQVK